MYRTRVIPCLLLKDGGLVKTVRFTKPRYVGDPINAIRIFNEKEVDELVVLDIMATRQRREPPYEQIAEIASECFMPVCYGGGITQLCQIERILKLGIEKISLNSALVERPELVAEAARAFGSQSIVASLDVKSTWLGGERVYVRGGRSRTSFDPITWARRVESLGAGEILLNSIDRDGTMSGFDLALTRRVADAVAIPVIGCGGAGGIDDLVAAVRDGRASAAAAGSLFVFHGKHRAVLISYPPEHVLRDAFEQVAADAAPA
ncbi:MAG: AglZ/HisF2 family acetamidino modification protein [Pirellulaceae bacterium]